MMRQAVLFVMGVVGAWVALAYPAYWFLGADGLIHSAVAAGLCLVPGLATLLWTSQALRGQAELQLVGVMGGTVVRLVVVAGATLVLYAAVPGFQAASFPIAVLVFYLITLGLELALILPAVLARFEAKT